MEKNEMKSKEGYEKLKISLISVLPSMTSFEQDVLKMRFGLDSDRCSSMGEVGTKFNISRKRIRQIEIKALLFLKRKNVSKSEMHIGEIKSKSKLSPFQIDVLNILASLPTNERDIVKLKYGLETGVELSDEDLFNKMRYYKLTQEELDKIKEKVHRRIEHKIDEFINFTLEE